MMPFNSRYRDIQLVANRRRTQQYRAIDSLNDQTVFVKVLSSTLTQNEEAVRAFANERRVWEELRSLGDECPILAFSDSGTWDGRPFVVQPYLFGSTVRELLQNTSVPLDARTSLLVIEKCFHALDVLHNAGYVHCDVSPENIFVATSPGESGNASLPLAVRLIDFEFARPVRRSREISQTVSGKLPYLAPELAQRANPSPQSDIFAAGIVLWECLTGTRPYSVQSIEELADLRHQSLPRPNTVADLPKVVHEYLRSLIDPDPEFRIPTARACLQQLRAFLEIADWLNPLANEGNFRKSSETSVTPNSLGTSAENMLDQYVVLSEAKASSEGKTESPSETAANILKRYLNRALSPAAFTLWHEQSGRRTRISERALVVGRGMDADFHILDPHVARRHAEFAFEEGKLVVRSIKGASVVVNGSEVAEAIVVFGDRIELGNQVFNIEKSSSADREAQSSNESTEITREEITTASFSISPEHLGSPKSEDDGVDLLSLVESLSVVCSVFSPSVVIPGAAFTLEVWAYPPNKRAEALAQAKSRYRATSTLEGQKPEFRGIPFSVMLQLDGFEVEQATDSFVWTGEIINVTYLVKTPAQLFRGRYAGQIRLVSNSLLVQRIIFEVTVGSAVQGTNSLDSRQESIRSAFASYASSDRYKVVQRVQGLSAAGIDVFLDVASLRAGQKWLDRLHKEIEERDVFYLFWSTAAMRSKFVSEEWRHALETRGLTHIHPVPLEDPEKAPPPSELQSLHFNDVWLAHLKHSEMSTKQTLDNSPGR